METKETVKKLSFEKWLMEEAPQEVQESPEGMFQVEAYEAYLESEEE